MTVAELSGWSVVQTAWAAGIVEGEGHVGFQRWPSGVITPEVNVSMTDEDVIDRFAALTGTPYSGRTRGEYKTIYSVKVCGLRAVGTMRRIFPYMGARRSERMAEVLGLYHDSRMSVCRACKIEFYWRSTGGHRPVTCPEMACKRAYTRQRNNTAQNRRRAARKDAA